MKYIKDFADGEKMTGIYFCKSRVSAVTKNGKQYDNVILQDKSGVIDAKIWDPSNPGIAEFAANDYIDVLGDISLFAGSLQVSIKRARIADETEYSVSDYMPCSRYSIDDMYKALNSYNSSIKNTYLKKLVDMFFNENSELVDKIKKSSAAKSVHHGFIGGLLEHTLGVVRLCSFYSKAYPVLNHDLIVTAALFHDIGKIVELSEFPQNDYTDDGQLIGHIIIGYQMVHEAIGKIEGFPHVLASELEHCILSHHGELEYGSPKKPALAEALALSLADLTDARMETMREILDSSSNKGEWLGYNKLLESNIRKTMIDDVKEE